MTMYKYLFLLTVTVCPQGVFSLPAHTQENVGDVVVTPESGALYREGLDHFNNNRLEEAVAKFEDAYRLDDRNINALFAHGYALTRLGRYNVAADILRQVLEQDPEYEKALRLLPVALTNAGKTDSALEAYDESIAKLPENYQLLYGKAVLLMKLERPVDAIPLLTRVSELQPENLDVLEKLAFAYRETGDMEQAYGTAKTIIAKNPEHGHARAIIGDYHRMRAEYDEALASYEIAAKDIETKAYAEHYIAVINQTLEEIEIEKEFEARMQNSAQ